MLTHIINGARTIWRRVSSSGPSSSSDSSADYSIPPCRHSEAMEAVEYFYWYQKFEEMKKNMSGVGEGKVFNDEEAEVEMMDFEKYADLCRATRDRLSSPADQADSESDDEDSKSEPSIDSSLELGSEYEDDTMSEWSEENFEFAYDCK